MTANKIKYDFFLFFNFFWLIWLAFNLIIYIYNLIDNKILQKNFYFDC